MKHSKRELIMNLVERLVTSGIDEPDEIIREIDIIDNVVCEALDIDKSEHRLFLSTVYLYFSLLQ